MGYNVYRSTNSGSYGSALATNVALSEYTDETVQDNTTYYYVVTAVDTSGNESGFSNEASFTVIPGAITYAQWAGGWGVAIGSETNDWDEDGILNLVEYALNGNPTNNLDKGDQPRLIQVGGSLFYVHMQRSNDTNLTYTVQSRTNLLANSWVSASSAAVGTNLMEGAFNEVTNTVDASKDALYLRLLIGN